MLVDLALSEWLGIAWELPGKANFCSLRRVLPRFEVSVQREVWVIEGVRPDVAAPFSVEILRFSVQEGLLFRVELLPARFRLFVDDSAMT